MDVRKRDKSQGHRGMENRNRVDRAETIVVARVEEASEARGRRRGGGAAAAAAAGWSGSAGVSGGPLSQGIGHP
jgi:hypothetical protein